MASVEILTRKDIELIVKTIVDKAIEFRVTGVELAVDKLRRRLNDLELLMDRKIYGGGRV